MEWRGILKAVREDPAFTRIAPWYEDLMSSVPYDMWTSYMKLVWSAVGIAPRHVLDVCCGTGTMCRILARDGVHVAGIDISPAMIAEANRRADKERLNIDFVVADAAEMELNRKFDAAFSFFDSLNYITEANRLAKAFERVAAHLNPHGVFLFDLNTAYAFEMGMFDQREKRKSVPVRYEWKSEWNAVNRLCTVHMEFEVDGERFKEVHVQRAYSEEELQSMLLGSGFHEVRFFDAYTLDPPRKRSDRIHVLALIGQLERIKYA